MENGFQTGKTIENRNFTEKTLIIDKLFDPKIKQLQIIIWQKKLEKSIFGRKIVEKCYMK